MTWPLKWGPTCSFDKLIELRAAAIEQMRLQGTKRFGWIDNEGGAIIQFYNDVDLARSDGFLAEPDRDGIVWGVKSLPPTPSTMCPSVETACVIWDNDTPETRAAYDVAVAMCRANGCECVERWERTSMKRALHRAVDDIDIDKFLRALEFEPGDEWRLEVRLPANVVKLETTSKRNGRVRTVVMHGLCSHPKDG